MREIKRKKRSCDCCGGHDLEELFAYSVRARTKSDVSFWRVRNVICRQCGFVFVSPCPTQRSLTAHYADSFEHSGIQKPDFSLPNRLKQIRRLCKSGRKSSYLEIGSNKCPDFISALSGLVGSVSTVEINKSCDRSYDDIESIRNTFDIIAAYFVLEHIPDPRQFLLNCRRIMNNSSHLIIEVPNLYLYPRELAGFLLCEHVNHFSPVSLVKIAARAGLEVFEISQNDCSRPFGFVAVFRKARRRATFGVSNAVEYAFAKSCMLDGKNRVVDVVDKISDIRRKVKSLARQKKDIIVWAANANCMKFLQQMKPIPASIHIVDSDPCKKDYLQGRIVHTPSGMVDKIRNAAYLVICSPSYASDIRRWILENTGRAYDESDSVIISDVM